MMNYSNFTTAGGKIVRHLYPKLDLFYFGINHDYPEVLKGEYEKAKIGKPIFLTKNFKGQYKISSSDKFGTVVLSWDEILKISDEEITKERPQLNRLMDTFNEKISLLQKNTKE